MTADRLLQHLTGTRSTGRGTWIARCPAHDDKHPSLSIREMADGKVLVKCWTGCSVDEVVAAAGLELGDLFPERPSHRGKPERRPFPAADVLRAVGREVLLVAVSASRLGNGGTLTDEDRARLLLAAARIGAAVDESGYGGG